MPDVAESGEPGIVVTVPDLHYVPDDMQEEK